MTLALTNPTGKINEQIDEIYQTNCDFEAATSSPVFHNRKGHRPGLAILIADVSTRQVQPQEVVATVGEGDDFDATEGVADLL